MTFRKGTRSETDNGDQPMLKNSLNKYLSFPREVAFNNFPQITDIYLTI